ncbi:HAD family hydrolase [Nonomuraea polychroma]|uniref:HAD family hydrolase n=1 Tax=Nonomuraea polychroma TaxID=46176 RepID=UPI003D9004C4
MRYSAVAVDYGGTISEPDVDPRLGQKPVAADAVDALVALHDLRLRLVLVSNNEPHEDRLLALRQAGVDQLFADLVLSQTGIGKPHPAFYRRAITACGVPAAQVLWVGNNLRNDVVGPLRHGVGAAALVGRPRPGEVLPRGALVIGHVGELPDLFRRWR